MFLKNLVKTQISKFNYNKSSTDVSSYEKLKNYLLTYKFLYPDYNRLNCHSAVHSHNVKERVKWEDYSLRKVPL